jgi:SAM-dependent methyltransferase
MASYAYYVGVVRKFGGSPKKIVDWGGGLGQVAKLASQYFADVECYLVDKGPVEEFWHTELGISGVRSGIAGESINKIAYDAGVVDIVISSGVLEHTFECGVSEAAALREIYRILSPNGKLFIWNLPTKWGLVDNVHKLLGGFYHNRRYTFDDTVGLLNNSGFDILKMEKHDLLFPRIKEWISKVLPPDIVFYGDCLLSKLPFISILASNFTIVAQKKSGFVFTPDYDGAIVFSRAAPQKRDI